MLRKIFDFVKKNPNITEQQISHAIGESGHDTSAAIMVLCKRGCLKRDIKSLNGGDTSLFYSVRTDSFIGPSEFCARDWKKYLESESMCELWY